LGTRLLTLERSFPIRGLLDTKEIIRGSKLGLCQAEEIKMRNLVIAVGGEDTWRKTTGISKTRGDVLIVEIRTT
jgi:hypothetical protein